MSMEVGSQGVDVLSMFLKAIFWNHLSPYVVASAATEWAKLASLPELWAHFYTVYFSHHRHSYKVRWRSLFRECYTTEFCGPTVAERVRKAKAQKPSVFAWGSKGDQPQFICDFDPTVIKVVLIGLPGAGKTSLIRSIKGQEFEEEHLSTMGASLNKCGHLYAPTDQYFKLHIWDCSGEERYTGFCQKLCGFSHIGLVLYESATFESLSTMKMWISELRKMKNVIIPCLARTKLDSTDHPANSEEYSPEKLNEIIEFATERNIPLLPQFSSKSGINVDALLDALCEIYLKNENDFDKS